MHTLWTPKIKIDQKSLDFLTRIPDDEEHLKQIINRDITRTFIINDNDLSQKFDQISSNREGNQQQKYIAAQHIITDHLQSLNQAISDENMQYFSSLIMQLCHQGFLSTQYALCDTVIQEEKDSLSEAGQVLVLNLSTKYFEVKNDNLNFIWVIKELLHTEDQIERFNLKMKWIFYPDKTMQMSMENPNDAMQGQGQEYFEILSTDSQQNLQKVLGELYKENDPYNFLAMNCDLKSCKLFTAIVNKAKCPDAPQILNRLIDLRVVDLTQELNPQDVSNKIQILKRLIDLKVEINPQEVSKQIQIITAIEKLSNSNSYTIARLIDKYITKNDKPDLDLSETLYDQLSPQCQTKIDQIASKLQERCESKGLLVTISDYVNIIMNFFMSIAEYFGLKTSAVTTQDFEKFCEDLAKESPVKNNSNKFSQTYQELKNSRHIDL